MKVRREYRDRDRTEVAVLDALADRYEDGMTVFELRSEVGADIDDLETALSGLKDDDLISAEEDAGRTVITVEDSVVESESTSDNDQALLEWIRDRLGL